MKRKPSLQEILRSAIALPSRPSRHKAAEHREIILVLTHKRLGHRAISAFLNEKGVHVHQTAISRYLRKYPPTEAEQRKIRDMLGAQASATASDAELRRKREESPAHVRRKQLGEPEDDIDYSFLNVSGRPFTIREEENN